MITGTIVLEGGATRGVFTSGILDYLMEEDLYFSHVIGVSAGSCNGVDYVSRQIGRTKKCMIPEKKEYSYYSGVRSAIKEKSILDMDMVFDTFQRKYIRLILRHISSLIWSVKLLRQTVKREKQNI